MQVIQSRLGIPSFLSDANKHLLSRKSHSIDSSKCHHSIIKPIAVQKPLIKPSDLFLSRKYNKSLNPVIGYDNWDESSLVNDSILTDYSQVNHSNNIFGDRINSQVNPANHIQNNDNSNPIVTESNDDIENIVNKKPQKSSKKKQGSNKTKTKKSTKPAKNSKSKVKSKIKSDVKFKNKNIINNDINSPTDLESLSSESIQQQDIDISPITDNNSETKIDSSFLHLDDDSEIVKSDQKNDNTQFLEEPDSLDSYNQETKVISSELPTIQKSNINILSNQNTAELDSSVILEKNHLNQSSNQQDLSVIKAEAISENIKFITPDITSPTVGEASTLENNFINHQNHDNQYSIISDSNLPISDTKKQTEIPLDTNISTSNSQSQSITPITSETQNHKFVSEEIQQNQENPDNLHLDISNIDRQKKEFLETPAFNESSNNQELSENPPITAPISKEISTVINDCNNHQDHKNQDSIQAGISLDDIVSPSNNKINISKTNSNQQFSNLSRSQFISTSTNEAQNNQIIPDLTQSEKFPIIRDEATESQSTGADNLEVKQIPDDFKQLENITQEIFQSQSEAKSSDITDNNKLIEAKLHDVNNELSIPKITDIPSLEIEQTNYISTQQNTPTYSQDVDNLIQTVSDVEIKESKQESKNLLTKSTSQINTETSNIENREEFQENVLESDSETEIIIKNKNPDLPVEQSKPDVPKIDTIEQESENQSDLSQKFNQKLDNILDKKQIGKKQKIQGYATGGKVIESKFESSEEIAPSDTVPAMLTPGEFVVNAKDTQQNIDFLQHINSGKKVEEIIQPSLEPSISPETPNTSLQKKASQVISSPASNLLTSSPLGLEVGEERLSLINSSDSKQSENRHHKITSSSTNNYSSSNLIFRKNNNHHTTNEVPSQWSNVEELLNSESSESDDFTTLFDFGSERTDSHKSEFSHITQTSSNSPRIAPKRIPEIKNFHQTREITPSNISRDIEPISETIQNPSFTNEADENKNKQQNTQDLEVLAHEIYLRLRQRLEIEKERLGVSFGRLPW